MLTVMQKKVGRERTGDASCVDGDAKKVGRERTGDEVRACFGVLMREAMEPAFLDDIVNEILQ